MSTVVTGAVSGATSGADKGDHSVIVSSFAFPKTQVRLSASDGGLTDPTNASFGFRVTKTNASTLADPNVSELGRQLIGLIAGTDPTSTTTPGIDSYDRIFTMNDLCKTGSNYYYIENARKDLVATNQTAYGTILSDGYDSFTAPLWGGFDGFDIHKPDPMYNNGMTGVTQDVKSYIYNTWKRAVDTVADPEFVDVNLMLAPGLTHDSLTQHMVTVCEDRADALALIS
jgi:hypothetical protein